MKRTKKERKELEERIKHLLSCISRNIDGLAQELPYHNQDDVFFINGEIKECLSNLEKILLEQNNFLEY